MGGHNWDRDKLDCDNGIIGNILSKIAKRITETFLSKENRKKVFKAAKLLKLIDIFFHLVFDSKRNSKK